MRGDLVRAVIYARVSIDEQEVENQRRQLHQLCEAQEREVVCEYRDNESGSRADRIQFRQMLADAGKRKWDLLVFWALDRFTREGTLATLKYLEQLETYGIRWRSFAEPWIDSAGPFRDVVISLLASLAKQERIRLKERVKAGLDRYRHNYNAARVGKEVRSKSGKNLPVGRPQRIFARQRVLELRAQGVSYRQIARRLGNWGRDCAARL
jgi:DNA invertase Pin-like site-specific DNA recombinase